MRITNDLVQSRFDKLARLKALGVAPYAYAARVSHRPARIQADPEPLIAASTPVEVAGRVVALRGHGKTSFAVIRDQGADLQLYFRKDDLGDEAYGLLEHLDLGDWIAARGTVFRTKTGEVTVAVQGFSLLAKALRPPPAKWHGLKDLETRYRQRYVDLIVNAGSAGRSSCARGSSRRSAAFSTSAASWRWRRRSSSRSTAGPSRGRSPRTTTRSTCRSISGSPTSSTSSG